VSANALPQPSHSALWKTGTDEDLPALKSAGDLPIAIIGAGPVGLAALAHAIERGQEAIVLEAGERVGANLLDYGHVQLFSPWRYSTDEAMLRQLRAHAWQAPPQDALPTARELVELLLVPFAELPAVAPRLRLGHRVVAVTRAGIDKVKSAGREAAPFLLQVEHAGQTEWLQARAVIDASGTWSNPNPLGAHGLPAVGEGALAQRIFYGLPDVLGAERARYAGKRVLVAGSGHSAVNTLLALAELAHDAPGTQLVWLVRGRTATRAFGGGEADALPARGRLGTRLRALQQAGGVQLVSDFRITAVHTAVHPSNGGIRVAGVNAAGEAVTLDSIDEIVCATGQRPDLGITRELRLSLDPWLESTAALGPLIDPNVHSCGTVPPHGHRELAHPEPGFYTVGVKSYGRAPTFLMATGYEQVRSVVAALAGDQHAADRVELELPETGVCGVPGDASGGCCAPRVKEVALHAASKAGRAVKVPLRAEHAAGGGCG
jgi:thioredoxin reductase